MKPPNPNYRLETFRFRNCFWWLRCIRFRHVLMILLALSIAGNVYLYNTTGAKDVRKWKGNAEAYEDMAKNYTEYYEIQSEENRNLRKDNQDLKDKLWSCQKYLLDCNNFILKQIPHDMEHDEK